MVSNLNLMESRRRILLNTPHLESASGSLVSFKTDVPANLKECKIHFTPVQEGEGTPSPDNVRPITGWDGVTVYHNDTSFTIPFPQTIYGGYVDLVKGEVVEEWKSFIADGTESSYPQNSSQRFTVPTDTVNKNLLYERTNPNHLICDRLLNTAANGMGNPIYRVAILSNQYLQMKITADIDTPELFREWLTNNNVQTVCKLATPNTYSLTPQTIKALRGLNNLWSNANGNLEIKFWKH